MAYYKFYRDRLRSNIFDLQTAFSKRGLELALSYSYKTNSMDCIYYEVNNAGLYPEVVSEYEYKESLKHCRPSKLRICNGVSMTYEQIAEHVKNGDLVNFNDAESIEQVGKIIGNTEPFGIGIRISYDDKSRFGVKAEDLSNAISVASKYGFKVDCFHCHATATRERERYRSKCKLIASLIDETGHRPRYIDLGGSMYSKLPKEMEDEFDDICTYDDYAEIIAEEFSKLDYKPVFILESGTALVSDVVDIVANVIRVDEYKRVVVDCTKYTLGMMHKSYIPYEVETSSKEIGDYKVYGCTCMEDDILIDVKGKPIPKVGDKIVFKNCGSYTYSIEPKFIIDRIGVEAV